MNNYLQTKEYYFIIYFFVTFVHESLNMEKHYAGTHYIQDLEALIKHHELQLLDLSAMQQAAQGFKSKIKEDCDSFAKDITEKLIFSWQKFKWFREQIAECETKKEKIAGELYHLYMQRFHMNVVHDK